MRLARELSGKKILIWGYGREGQSTFSFIRQYCEGSSVDVADGREIVPEEGMNRVIVCPAGEKPNLSEYDYVFKAPGIPVVGFTQEELARLTSQTQMFMEAYRDQIIGVTGTKGKSTTASLTARILSECGRDALLVGNIGLPCFDFAARIQKDTIIVFELSCHQLEVLTVSPHIAVILNLYPDHLDHYGTFEKYASAKVNILRNQRQGDYALVNEQVLSRLCHEDAGSGAMTRELLELWKREGVNTLFAKNGNASHEDSLQHGELTDHLPLRVDVEGHDIRVGEEYFTLEETATKLPGLHNVYNIGIVYELYVLSGGTDRAAFLNALSAFEGLPHRLQYVATVNGVRYYDDSISTVCETAIQAAVSVPDVRTMIIGGMDRGIDYTELVEFLLDSDVRTVLLLPDTNSRIAALYEEMRVHFQENARPYNEAQQLVFCKDMEEAVREAAIRTCEGEACVLSPAAASYGFYKNFEERGEVFAALVRAM